MTDTKELDDKLHLNKLILEVGGFTTDEKQEADIQALLFYISKHYIPKSKVVEAIRLLNEEERTSIWNSLDQ